jgi:protein-histidine pros-kinase
MLRSFIQIETRRQVVCGTIIVTAASVALSVLITYIFVRGSAEEFVKTGLLISLIVPMLIAPFATGAIMEMLRQNFQLSHELKLAAKVAERLAISEATAKARQSANEALESELAERKRIEAEMRTSNRALVSANAVKSRFLATINREIRAPMGDILGSIEVLSETDLSPQQTGPLEDLQRSSFGLFTTINDILDLSQLEAGEVDLQSGEFDLAGCVEDCIDLFAGAASSKGVDIVLNIAPSVPWRVLGDERRLRQVLENLIGNAVKFTHRGRIRVSVSAAAETAGGVRFDVSDTGIGFSDEAKSVLFEAFGAAGASVASGGAGLGLVISQHLVRLMNGVLAINSQPGKGAVVSFTAEFGTVDGTILADATEGIRDARVLLVTSRSSTRHQIGTYLSMGGAACEFSATADDALTALRQGTAGRHPFDAVILDLGKANADLARSIQAHTAFDRLKVIAIASPGEESAPAPYKMLTRPVQPDQLRDAIIGAEQQPAKKLQGRARALRSSASS